MKYVIFFTSYGGLPHKITFTCWAENHLTCRVSLTGVKPTAEE